MGKVTGSWERPIQGISQQADKDRQQGQCTLQENLIPSPLTGLIKRIGTRHVAKLLDSVHADSLWYLYERGGEETYILVIEPNSQLPLVFDIQGNPRVVNGGAGFPYLSTDKPQEDLAISTVADYSFILNNKVDTAMKADVTETNANIAILYCQFATYARDYKVYLDDTLVASHSTPDGSQSSHAELVKTDYVMGQLAEQINNNGIANEIVGATALPYSAGWLMQVEHDIISVLKVTNRRTDAVLTAGREGARGVGISFGSAVTGDTFEVQYTYAATTGFSAEIDGNTAIITKNTGSTFSIKTSDSSDGNDLIAVQDRVGALVNLPPAAPEGHIVKVQQTEGREDTAYWLKAEARDVDGNDATGSRVRWVETVAQGVQYMVDESTMPLTLISEADGTFTFSEGTWDDRQAGDDKTNPLPSFLGKRINSIGTFQNRLLFTSGESAIFSRTSEFFNFFKESSQASSPADPVDAFADTDEVNDLIHHAVLDGDIVFFAANGQFLIQGKEPLTPDVVFKKVTSYPINTNCAPAITGESVMFTFVAGRYAGVREMFTDSLTDTKRARPITEHIREYIKGVPTNLISSPNINTLFIQTDDDDSVLYTYDWLWSGDQRVQAAWHKWVFSGDVLFASFVRDVAYFVVQRTDGIYLESLPISNDEDEVGLTFPARLDRRSTVTAIYDGFKWTFTLPYEQADIVAVRGEGCWDEDKGTDCILETEDNINFVTYDDLADVEGGQTTCSLIVGTKYTSKYIPTKPFLRDGNGRALSQDRFTLGKIQVNYESIGDTKISVIEERSRREWQYDFNGRKVGGWSNQVGFAPLDSGDFEIPIRLEAKHCQIQLETDDYRPFVLRDMEWTGLFKQRGRRL